MKRWQLIVLIVFSVYSIGGHPLHALIASLPSPFQTLLCLTGSEDGRSRIVNWLRQSMTIFNSKICFFLESTFCFFRKLTFQNVVFLKIATVVKKKKKKEGINCFNCQPSYFPSKWSCYFGISFHSLWYTSQNIVTEANKNKEIQLIFV